MALEKVVELQDDVRIGFDAEAGETGQIQVLVGDSVEETFDVLDDVMPPCCLRCIEDGAWVEIDGRCPHGRLSYTRKVGLA